MMNSLASIVNIIHWILILFIVLVPFIGNELLLSLHAILIPGIMMHWVTNNNVCSLTALESSLSGKPVNDTFFGKLLLPLFNVGSKITYFIMLTLLFITILRLQQTDFRLLKLAFKMTIQYLYTIIDILSLGISSKIFDLVTQKL